jgi:hypothetical protein
VQDLLGRNYDDKTSLQAFMKSANVVVNAIVTCAAAKGATLSTEQLERIEAHLACHYYQRADPGFSSKNTGRSAAAFHGQTGMMLQSTHYGQDAIGMDTSGCLSSFNNGGRTGMMWLGKPPSEQIDYVDRD